VIKLRLLIESTGKNLPDPSLAEWILQNRTTSLSEWLYHGTPLEGLKSILFDGIRGTDHGEVAEHKTFSTSINSEVLDLFSEREGTTGLQFKIKNSRVIILDDILTYLVTQLPGSGFGAEIEDESQFEEFVKKFKIPIGHYKNTPYLPYDYLSSLGVDAFMFEYVYKRMQQGRSPSLRDESEICFIGNKGIDLLNKSITGIWVYDHEYEPNEKVQALQDIDDRL
jgi:hypothetical protein